MNIQTQLPPTALLDLTLRFVLLRKRAYEICLDTYLMDFIVATEFLLHILLAYKSLFPKIFSKKMYAIYAIIVNGKFKLN